MRKEATAFGLELVEYERPSSETVLKRSAPQITRDKFTEYLMKESNGGLLEKDHNLQCPLCGQLFNPDGSSCSAACPLSRQCNLVCCPNCGYSYPKDSRTIEFFKKLFKRKESHEFKS